jgi:hypothetical protein
MKCHEFEKNFSERDEKIAGLVKEMAHHLETDSNLFI